MISKQPPDILLLRFNSRHSSFLNSKAHQYTSAITSSFADLQALLRTMYNPARWRLTYAFAVVTPSPKHLSSMLVNWVALNREKHFALIC